MLQKKSLRRFSVSFFKKITFVALVFFLFIFLIKTNDFFSVNNFVVYIDKEMRKNIFGLDEFKKSNILFLETEKIKDNLIKKNPDFKKVSVEKKYPDTLLINIVLDKPLAVLRVDLGYFYLNGAGKIFKKTRKLTDKNLTEINFYQKLNFKIYSPGDFLNFREIKSGLFILEKMDELNIGITNLDINSNGVLLFSLKDKKFFFNSEKDIEVQWHQFKEIYREFEIKNLKYKEIDLRFDKPVVRF